MNPIEDRMRVSPEIRQPGNALPEFLKAAVNLGRELYRSSVAGLPRTVILTVPTRDFLSVSVSLGAADAALSCSNREAPKPEVGDNVIALLANGEYYIAKYEGEASDSSSAGRMRTFLGLKGNQRISVFSDAVTVLRHPRGTNAKVGLSTFGSKNTAPAQVALSQAVFELKSARDLYLPTPAASIVGTKTWIEEDLCDFSFTLDGHTVEVASLNAVLLAGVGRILPPLVDVQAYSASGLRDIRSHVTILDGANVPLRHGLGIGHGSQLIVLDASTPEATLDLALSACANRVDSYEQDLRWPPINHRGFSATERASFLRTL